MSMKRATLVTTIATALLSAAIGATAASAGPVTTLTARPAFTLPTATTETTSTATPVHTYGETNTARPAFTLPVETSRGGTVTVLPAHSYPELTTAIPAFTLPTETATNAGWSIPTTIPALVSQRTSTTTYAAVRRIPANTWAWPQKRKLRLVQSSKLVFKASAGKDRVQGTVTLKTATTVSRPVKVGSALVDLKPGTSGRVVVKLSQAAVRAVKKTGHTQFVAVFTSKDGSKQTSSLLITVSA